MEPFPELQKDTPARAQEGEAPKQAEQNASEPDIEQEALSRKGSALSRKSGSTVGEVQQTRCERLVQSNEFELTAALLILVNTVVMAFELQYKGIEAGYESNFPDYMRPAREAWPGAVDVFMVMERCFTIVFTVEFFIRLAVLGPKMLRQPLNWLDIAAVLVGWLDWLLSSAVVNPMVIRLLRLAKLARGFRLARVGRLLGSLQLILKSIQASAFTLSWSLVIIMVLQCLMGMILCQLVHPFIMDPNQDSAARQEVFAYYGSFSRSMITMFEVHFANFAPACRVLVNYLGEGYAFLFLGYRCLAGFAVLNVINAVFIQQTMKVAQQDTDIMFLMIEQQQKANARYKKELKEWFQSVDENNDNQLSWEELQQVQNEPNLKLWMRQLEIEPSSLRSLYDIIDTNGDGSISFDELLDGATKIKGTAKNVDLVYLLTRMDKLDDKVNILLDSKQASSSSSREAVSPKRQDS